jgi:hypothetical protein
MTADQIIARAEELTALTKELWRDGAGEDFESCLKLAERMLPGLEGFADVWNDEAQRAERAVAEARHRTGRDAQPEPVYVPSALEPHEQRAVDKAMFERGRGIVPQLVGRFWFVPSRTTGGTVYRVTLDTCTCKAAEAGRLCWHRALIGLERELAA